jgi:hypothetical protein
MIISLCIPCMNRTHDLKQAMPYLIEAANASPPVEIAVLDYNSQDELAEYVESIKQMARLQGGNKLTCNKYTGRDYYHLAHAYNLAVLATSGEYVAVMGADAILSESYVVEARKLIADGCVWMRGRHYKGIFVCARDEFIQAGGYDERFEFYGGEDKDLEMRLQRRGSKFGLMPDGLVHTLRTGNAAKVKNYRLDLTKREMMQRGSRIRAENNTNAILVANEGKEWGQWTGP